MASKPPQHHAKPTSNNPWDVPPASPTGSATQLDIYQSVGRALHAWEYLEEHLADLFAILCETGSIAAKRAYGAAVAHGARSDMLKAAGEVYFYRYPAEEEIFTGLMKDIGKLSGRRNDIAHGICIHKGAPRVSFGYFLYPPHYNSRKTAMGDAEDSKYCFTADQIDDYAASFSAYSGKILELVRRLLMPQS